VIAGAVLGASVALGATELRARSAGAPPAAVPAVKPAPNQYHRQTSAPAAAPPRRLAISELGLDAAVESVDPTPNLMVGVPRDVSEVAWYDLGSSPGQPGDAIIAGHLDSQTGAPAVFAGLGRLHAGSPIRVLLADGVTKSFHVDRVYSTPYNRVPEGLFSKDGPARISLITCAGAWDTGKRIYLERLVVEATADSN
jgi:sortase (surface protein transpeptidase)